MVESTRCGECRADLGDMRGHDYLVCPTCHRVAFATRAGRSSTGALPFPVPDCRDLIDTLTRALASSEQGPHTAQAAIDGTNGSMWNPGTMPPVWWCADFGEVLQVRGVTLIAAMVPAIGQVHHVIECSSDGNTWEVGATLDQTMTDAGVYAVDFGKTFDAQWVRINTESSRSRVGWYEIGIFAPP